MPAWGNALNLRRAARRVANRPVLEVGPTLWVVEMKAPGFEWSIVKNLAHIPYAFLSKPPAVAAMGAIKLQVHAEKKLRGRQYARIAR